MLVTKLVNEINQILEPYWKFSINDIYGDQGSAQLPNIEDLPILYWKLDGHKNMISKSKQTDMLNQVNMLLVKKNIEQGKIIQIQSIGKFISIQLPPKISKEEFYSNW